MAQTASKFYTVLIVGDNPDELLSKYQIGKRVDKYIKYHYLDASKLQANSIKILNGLISNYKSCNLTKFQCDGLKERLKAIQNMSSFEYYQTITEGCTYDENGDAWSDINPNGKWVNYQTTNHFSNPFLLNDGTTSSSALNKDINWKELHLSNVSLFETTWELIKENRQPQTEEEHTIVQNMSGLTSYFDSFKSKEDYVIHNSSYFTTAYLDANGWIDMDDEGKTDINWIKNFFDRFIKPLKDDDKVTIIEFTRNSDEEY